MPDVSTATMFLPASALLTLALTSVLCIDFSTGYTFNHASQIHPSMELR